MANRVATPNLFAPAAPNWSLALLDQNAQSATGAINDSSLGAVNGPLTDTGSVNAYAVTCAYGTPSAYNDGMTVFFRPANTNTGASTLTVSPLGSLPIVAGDSSALVGGELVAGNTIGLVCDGTAFRIFSYPGGAIVPLITSVRLRSFSSVGNPTFEVDQRNVASSVSMGSGSGFLVDRWQAAKGGTMAVTAQQITQWALGSTTVPLVPGTNFQISKSALKLTLTTQETTLGATDQLGFYQEIEASVFRELCHDVTSLSLLVWSDQAPLKFSAALIDGGAGYTICYLCTVTTASTWQLITLPNIPLWPSAGNYGSGNPGSLGYYLSISLAAGSSLITPSPGVWVNAGTYRGAPGMDNWCSKPVNSNFSIAFVQHEPGAVCTTLIDCPFENNLRSALRYYQKSYGYSVKAGTVTNAGVVSCPTSNAYGTVNGSVNFPVKFAKTPTITIYDPGAGGASQLRTNEGSTTLYAITGPNASSDSGFYAIGVSPSITASGTAYFHWVGDTGW